MAEPQLPDVVTLAIPAFAALIAAELIYQRLRRRADAFELKDMTASLLMGVGNAAVKAVIGGAAVWIYVQAYQFRLFDIPYAWWSFLLCFFAEDLAYYWFHRLAHERRFFWASHVVHHTSQFCNLSTALRQPWTGLFSLNFLFWLPLLWIGFPPPMVLFFSGVSLVYQFWIHTEAVGRLGPLEWVLNTPSHHRVHHATNPRYLDRNYAGVLIIWDRLFGTFEREEERPRYGVLADIATFNPLRIALHEWAAMGRDVFSAKGLKEALGYAFGPPGWRPDGRGRTSEAVRAEWRAGLAQPAE